MGAIHTHTDITVNFFFYVIEKSVGNQDRNANIQLECHVLLLAIEIILKTKIIIDFHIDSFSAAQL